MALNNKVAVVSGGSRGIGRAIVLALAAKSTRIAFTFLGNKEAADDLADKCKNLPGFVRPYMVDIRDQIKVKEMLGSVVREWGKIDIIVNNAGIKRDKTIAFMSPDDWDSVLSTNLTGAFYLTQASIYYMLKRRRGRIINIASLSGINGIAGQTNYSSSKAALMGFTRSLAKEVAGYGICVNAVAPGGVDTDMLKDMKEEDVERLLRDVPIGRLCTPDEVAKIVLFLSDDEMSPDYLTGTVITLDGGYGL